jgi:hypothetical protein
MARGRRTEDPCNNRASAQLGIEEAESCDGIEIPTASKEISGDVIFNFTCRPEIQTILLIRADLGRRADFS